jgi:hypothetical protein
MRLDEKEQEHLSSVLNILNRAKKTLDRTYSKCKAIGIKEVYSEDEMDQFEVLVSKFARTTYIISDKGFRLINDWDLEEPFDSIIELIVRAEKKGLVPTAKEFIGLTQDRKAHV